MAENDEEVKVGPDEGELLMIRRALSGYASQDRLEQREAIFHTRCTIGGKVCSLIIDGGSCTNVASQTLVNKLELAVSPHRRLHNIEWLNQGKGLQVSSQCLLSLSIGQTYKDEIWCDVLPMDVCHILLGRPWMFDRNVLHDGCLNTYSFAKDGRTITLTLIQPSQTPKPQKALQKNLLLTPLHPICLLYTSPSPRDGLLSRMPSSA